MACFGGWTIVALAFDNNGNLFVVGTEGNVGLWNGKGFTETSKSAEQFINEPFDIVVTGCDSAAQDCPSWPGAKRFEHWPIVDPSYGPDDPATRYDRFVETRDELARRIDELVKTL